MSNNKVPTIVFISAPVKQLGQLDLALFHAVGSAECHSVLGSYKGVHEVSRMVVLSSPDELEVLKRIAADFQQESILVRNGDESCELHYTSSDYRAGQVELLRGRLQEVSGGELSKYPGWTRFGNKYYTIK